LYGYAFSDPINLIDIDGETPAVGAIIGAPLCPVGVIVGAILGAGVVAAAILASIDSNEGSNEGDICQPPNNDEPKGGHIKNARKSTKDKHEEADARRAREQREKKGYKHYK
jgi:hypothetical protein